MQASIPSISIFWPRMSCTSRAFLKSLHLQRKTLSCIIIYGDPFLWLIGLKIPTRSMIPHNQRIFFGWVSLCSPLHKINNCIVITRINHSGSSKTGEPMFSESSCSTISTGPMPIPSSVAKSSLLSYCTIICTSSLEPVTSISLISSIPAYSKSYPHWCRP